MFGLAHAYQTSANLKSAQEKKVIEFRGTQEWCFLLVLSNLGRQKQRPNRWHKSNKGLSIVVSLWWEKKKVLCLESWNAGACRTGLVQRKEMPSVHVYNINFLYSLPVFSFIRFSRSVISLLLWWLLCWYQLTTLKIKIFSWRLVWSTEMQGRFWNCRCASSLNHWNLV